jgi:hypothetical protein
MEEINEFTVFEAMDRVSTLIKMQDELLGSVFEDEFELNVEDVHPALVKHHEILKVVQDNLMELYQLLGQDLYMKGETK